MRRPLVALALALALPLAGSTSAVAVRPSTMSGDPYFPQAGNGGYDVQHYGLRLRYEPSTGRLDGTAVITFTATRDLTGFSLDLRGLTASSVLVDARGATATQRPPRTDGSGGELVVQPAKQLPAGSSHVVSVGYGGTPRSLTDDSGEPYGFVPTDDGAFVANQPDGAATWYPVNDLLTDKATYDFTISVPEGTTAVANGRLVGTPRTTAGRTVFTWRAPDPMSSYLSTATIGDYVLSTQTGPHGLPIDDYVDAGLGDAADDVLALQPRMVAFFEQVYGRYPFSSFGAIVSAESGIGYALETTTRPLYAGPPDEVTVAHELAHQWLGDSVTPTTWRDIWLNEGFATWSEWLWQASRQGPSLQQSYEQVMSRPADDAFWRTPPGDPGVENLFSDAVYLRGAATLYALRALIGGPAFGTLLRRWATENAGSSVSTADLVALAEQVGHRQLDAFFRTWLYTPEKPAGG